jgi:hypothetical protein
MADLDLDRITHTRREAAEADTRLRAVEARRRRAEAERDGLLATGAASDDVRRATERVEATVADAVALVSRLSELRDAVGELSDELIRDRTPEDGVAHLDGRVPVALLPVRIETRFADGGATLHVRIFPEQVHVDSHEPELTDDEVAAASEYWRRRWKGADEARGAWEAVASRFRPTRARYIVDTLTPTNSVGDPAGPQFPEVDRRGAAWGRAGRAVALPDRWAVIGLRGGQPLFRVWSGFVPDELAVTPTPGPDGGEPAGEGVPVDAGLRWLVDPVAARDAGMLVTVRDGDLAGGARLRDGIDELVVVGADWTRSPGDAAAELGRALTAHAYTDGLAFVAQGTPTNNTSTSESGHTSARSVQVAALEPSAESGETDPVWSAGRRLAGALGLDGAVARQLDRAPGATRAEQAVARSLLDATWEATGGYYLGQLMRPADGQAPPLVQPVDIDLVREWAAANVFACGPLPTVRVGSQPYGIVPVVDPAAFVAEPAARAAHLVHGAVGRLRTWWERGVAAVPRIDAMGAADDLDAILLALLQQSPVAATLFFRRVFGPVAVANLEGFDDLAQHQRFQNWVVASMVVGRMAGRLPTVAGLTTDARSHRLPVPFARPADLAAGAPLPYVGEIRDLLTAAGGRQALVSRSDASTLGEAFLAAAAAAELDTTHGRVAATIAERLGLATPLRDSPRVDVDELLRVGGSAGGGALTFGTPREVGEAAVPGASSGRTIAEQVRADILEIVGGTRPPRPELDGLTRTVRALDRLRDVPGEEVEWGLRGLLEVFSHRLDAWHTGLAHDRLTRLRTVTPAGVHVGCFGWVENLRPDPPGRDTLGWVHTPSLGHAAAAAVLRSGHLEHRGEASEVLAIDLSSSRVRTALSVLDGVSQGQPLGALIGYRIERMLRERDIELARYILPLRLFAPLRHTDAELNQPTEAIAARDVVDGVALLDRWAAAGGRAAVFAAAAVRSQDQAGVAAVLDAAASAYDAVSDVLVAESVFQMVRGNSERASAALAALDRQELPVRPEVVDTPRSGAVVTHRVVALLAEDDTTSDDPMAAAEPRLNAWAARLLGPAEKLVLAGEVRRDGQVRATVHVSADALGLSPLGFVLAAGRTGAGSGGPSELEARVARALAAEVGVATDDDRLLLLDEPPAGAGDDVLGLAAARSLANWIGRVAQARAADGRDLDVLPGSGSPGIDVNELRARADAAVAALDRVVVALTDASSGSAVLAALEAASRLGVPDTIAVAGSETVPSQAARALAYVTAARQQVADLAASDTVEHHLARLHAVFGEGFPVLPLFTMPEPGGVSASMADRAALLHGDDLAPLSWLHRMALVRPELDALSSALTAAEALDRDVDLPRLEVLQLPHEPGRRWVAHAGADDGAATGTVGIVVHAPGGLDPTRPVAGVVVDQWTETIPFGEETTGLTFQYDAPAARAPQAIVLAVPGRLDADRWSFERLLATVREAMALTRIRAVGPKELPDLGGFLPAVYLPANFSRDVPSVDPFEIIRSHTRVSAANPVMGRE